MQRISERLKTARRHSSLSQQDVAAVLDVSRTSISQLEAGKRPISTLELTLLSKLYRRNQSWLLNSLENYGVVMETLQIQANAGRWKATAKHSVENAINLCADGISVKKTLGRNNNANPPVYGPSLPKSKGQAFAQGEYFADIERARLKIGTDPISNMVKLIADQEIWVSTLDLPSHVSGLFINEARIGKAVLINGGHDHHRQRFAAVHEYAHSLFERPSMLSITSVDKNHAPGDRGDALANKGNASAGRSQTLASKGNASAGRRHTLASKGDALAEHRANGFAGAFLLPEGGLLEELRRLGKGRPPRRNHLGYDVAGDALVESQTRVSADSQQVSFHDVALIAHRFDVSFQLAASRLASLGYIGKRQLNDLHSPKMLEQCHEYLRIVCGQVFPAPANKRENAAFEVAAKVMHLAIEAYRQELISASRLREYATSAEFDCDEIYELAVATMDDEH